MPGSGGKDSFFAAHVLKTKYGMHPLTVTWAPHVYTEWGWKNFQSWIHAGHDNYLMTPNGRVHRLLTRLSTEVLFHPFQAFMFGQKALAPKMALLFKIPLVFYGENETEYGNPSRDAENAQRDWAYFAAEDQSRIFLGGVSVSDLKTQFGVDQNDLQPYLPADPNRLVEQRVEVHYLGYYLKWHPQSCYYYAVEHGGFQAAPERTPGTYSKYNSIDDKIDDFHYYTTFIKFGIGRATYDAAQEIRNGHISREEGVALVRRFDGEFPERYFKDFLDYIGISRERFFELIDQFRSPHLWEKRQEGWHLRHQVA